MREVRAVVVGETPYTDYRLEVRRVVKGTVEGSSLEVRQIGGRRHDGKFRLLINDEGLGFRWLRFENRVSVDIRAHQDGQPGLVGGGFEQIRTAIATWNDDPGSEIFYRWGGTTTATGGLSRSDSLNTIVFGDANDVFDSDYSCESGGVIAAGGATSRFDGTVHERNGQAFEHTAEVDVLVNDGAIPPPI